MLRGSFGLQKGHLGMSARWFENLSEELLGLYATFFMKLEGMGIWPEALRHSLLHLIPKPGGGRRPIGLIDGTCRLWELVRKEIVTRWSRH